MRVRLKLYSALFAVFAGALLFSCANPQLPLDEGWVMSSSLGGSYSVTGSSTSAVIDCSLVFNGTTQRALALYYIPASNKLPSSYTVSFKIKAASMDAAAYFRVPVTQRTYVSGYTPSASQAYPSTFDLLPAHLTLGVWHTVVVKSNVTSKKATLSVDGTQLASYSDGADFGYSATRNMWTTDRTTWCLLAQGGSSQFTLTELRFQ